MSTSALLRAMRSGQDDVDPLGNAIRTIERARLAATFKHDIDLASQPSSSLSPAIYELLSIIRGDAGVLVSNSDPITPHNGSTAPQMEGGKVLPIDQFVQQQLTMNNIAVAGVTLYIWEYLTTLSSEWELYRHTSWRNSAQPWLFALVRYGTLPAVVLPAYSVWTDFSNHPGGCVQHQMITIVFVQLIVAIVFVWRTVAIWDRDIRIIVFLGTLTALQFGASFALLWFTTETLLSNGACMPLPQPGMPDLQAWFYLIAFLFDATTIGLSFFKLAYYSDLPATTVRNAGKPSFNKRKSNNLFSSDDIASEKQGERHHTSSPSSDKTRDLKQSPMVLRTLTALKTTPYHALVKLRWRWYTLTLTPLLSTLSRNGVAYLTLASAFNVANLGLELSQSIHSKALIALYAPIMCVACQRIILSESKAMHGGAGAGAGRRHSSLKDGVVQLSFPPTTGGSEMTDASLFPAAGMAGNAEGSPWSRPATSPIGAPAPAPSNEQPAAHTPGAISNSSINSTSSVSTDVEAAGSKSRRESKSTTLVGALLAERRHSWEGEEANGLDPGTAAQVNAATAETLRVRALREEREREPYESENSSGRDPLEELLAEPPQARVRESTASSTGTQRTSEGLPMLSESQASVAIRMAGF